MDSPTIRLAGTFLAALLPIAGWAIAGVVIVFLVLREVRARHRTAPKHGDADGGSTHSDTDNSEGDGADAGDGGD